MAAETENATEAEKAASEAQSRQKSELQTSNYDIIRSRLEEQAAELRKRAETLNHQRQEIFGSTEMTVIGQDRIRTENSCFPQDMVQIGGRLLFGYTVSFGLKQKTDVDDVFSMHAFEKSDQGFAIAPLAQESEHNFLSEDAFVHDFDEIYTYYSGVRLAQLHRTENRLFAVLELGEKHDRRVLRWGIENEVVSYLDNAGHLEFELPEQHDFDWRELGREAHIRGKHPHVSVEDEVFVETVGGDLTIKIEDNTEAGHGIYDEPVEDPRQSLNDADFEYSRVGNLILIRILPYREEHWRYFVFNTLTQSVGQGVPSRKDDAMVFG